MNIKEAKYRKVYPHIWNDEKFMRLSTEGKFVFLFLLTHPNMTALGAMRANSPGMACDLGWESEAFAKAFREVLREGMARHDPKACFLCLPNFLKYNQPESPNVVRSWVASFPMIPECELKYQLFAEITALSEGYGKGFREAFREAFGKPMAKAIGKAMPNQEPEQEQEQEQEQEPEPEPEQDRTSIGDIATSGQPDAAASAGESPKSKPNPNHNIVDETILTKLCASPAYKGIDVRREYLLMLEWLKNNPKGAYKRPTKARFCAWLNRVKPYGFSSASPPSKPIDLTAEARRCDRDYFGPCSTEVGRLPSSKCAMCKRVINKTIGSEPA